MRTPPAIILLMLAFLAPLRAAPEPTTAKEAFARHSVVYSVIPRYSNELQRRGVRGSGIFDMEFDFESGRIHQVHIVRSTGNDRLDRDTIFALRRWRVKPHSVRIIRLPITFAGTFVYFPDPSRAGPKSVRVADPIFGSPQHSTP
jgi:TonB family protein